MYSLSARRVSVCRTYSKDTEGTRCGIFSSRCCMFRFCSGISERVCESFDFLTTGGDLAAQLHVLLNAETVEPSLRIKSQSKVK